MEEMALNNVEPMCCNENVEAMMNNVVATINNSIDSATTTTKNFHKTRPAKRKIDQETDCNKKVLKKLSMNLEGGQQNLLEISNDNTETPSHTHYTLRSRPANKDFEINLDFSNNMSHNNNIQVSNSNRILSDCKFFTDSNNLNISSPEEKSIKDFKMNNSLEVGVKKKKQTSILNKTWDMRKQTILRSRSSKSFSNAACPKEQVQSNSRSASSDRKYLAIVKKCNQVKSLSVASRYGNASLAKNTTKVQTVNKFPKKELATKTLKETAVKRNLPAQTKTILTPQSVSSKYKTLSAKNKTLSAKNKTLSACKRNGPGSQTNKNNVKTKKNLPSTKAKNAINFKHNSHLKPTLTPKKRPVKKQKLQEISTKKKKVGKEGKKESAASKKNKMEKLGSTKGIVENETHTVKSQKPNSIGVSEKNLKTTKTTDAKKPQTKTSNSITVKKELSEQKVNQNSVINPVSVVTPPRTSSRSNRAHKRLMNNGWRWIGRPVNRYVQPLVGGSPVQHRCFSGMVNSDGDVINAGDCVLVKSGTRKCDIPYVARIAALYSDPDTGSMMAYLLWYYSPDNVDGCHVYKYQKNELFGSRHADENPVACLDEKCYVVTFAEYCRYMSTIRRAERKQEELGIVPRIRYPRRGLIPGPDTDPDLVFFSRAVYDVKLKRLVKNPFKTDDGIMTRRQTRNMSTLLSQLSALPCS